MPYHGRICDTPPRYRHIPPRYRDTLPGYGRIPAGCRDTALGYCHTAPQWGRLPLQFCTPGGVAIQDQIVVSEILFFLASCFASFAFEQKRLAGFEREDGDAGGARKFPAFARRCTECRSACRDSGLATFTATAPPSLPASSPPRARHLSVPSKPSTASTVAVFDDDQLADFQPRNFLGDAEAEFHVRPLLVGKFRAEVKTGLPA